MYGLKFRQLTRPFAIAKKGKNMIRVYPLTKKCLLPQISLMKTFMNYTRNVSTITQNFLSSNQFPMSETRIHQWRMCANSISFGTTSKLGENSVNMMNMTLKKPKIDMKKGGWNNKTKRKEQL